MQIINLTPHDITILNEQKEVVKTVLKSGKVARLDSDKIRIPTINSPNNIPFFETRYGIPVLLSLEDKNYRALLPERKTDVIYIVSSIFRSGYDHPDLWQPGELVLDDKGQPIGYIGLSQ